jgi:hypothetical protein
MSLPRPKRRLLGSNSVQAGAKNGSDILLKFEFGGGLVLANTAGGDVRLVKIFALDGSAGKAAKHGELADVVEGIGDGTLKEAFGGSVEPLAAGQVIVKILQSLEVAIDFLRPGERFGAVPGLIALGHVQSPVKKIAQVGEDLGGGASGFSGTEISKGVGRVAEGLATPISNRGQAVAQEVACADGVWKHRGFLVEIEGALEGALFGVDLFLELENGVENRFRARRTAGNVNIDRNDLVAALEDSVVVENAAGSSTSAHGNDPLGLRHLIVKLANDGAHFDGKATGDDHEVGLPGRRTKNFCAETGEVVAGGSHGHHLDGATGEAKAEGPDGTLASPVHGLVELGKDDAFVLKELAEIVGFGERNALAQSRFHVALVTSLLFWHSGGGMTNGRKERRGGTWKTRNGEKHRPVWIESETDIG